MGGQFRILVVGGGIAGLSTAYILRRNGHIVTVLEASKQLSENGAGIQIPPNSTRILEAYDLTTKLEKVIVQPSHINLRRYANGKVIGETPLVPDMVDNFGCPYWVVHRADYLDLLHRAAVEAGVHIRLNCRVENVDLDAVSVKLTEGATLSADLIIGADGIRSKVRGAILGPDDVNAIPSADNTYRALVSREKMMADSTTAELMTSPAANCWIGHDKHIMAYPIRNGSVYNIVTSQPGHGTLGKWNEPADVAEMNEMFSEFDPVIRKALGYVDSALNWLLADIPALPRWRSQNGRVILVGDSAHAMLPYLSQGAACAIEDGAVLAECLIRAGHTDDIDRLTEAYETIRKGRVERIQERARVNGVVWHYEDGEAQERRDRAMQGELKAGEINPNVWADKAFQPWLFGHDAIKDANEKLEAMLMR